MGSLNKWECRHENWDFVIPPCNFLSHFYSWWSWGVGGWKTTCDKRWRWVWRKGRTYLSCLDMTPCLKSHVSSLPLGHHQSCSTLQKEVLMCLWKNWRELRELVGLFGPTGVPVCQGIWGGAVEIGRFCRAQGTVPLSGAESVKLSEIVCSSRMAEWRSLVSLMRSLIWM